MRLAVFAVVLALAGCSTQHAPAPTAQPVQTIAPSNIAAFFDCVRAGDGAIIAAHRGGPAPGFAENSIEAFENTLAKAPAMMEIDVVLLADGSLALMHDDMVDRTTNGTGRVATYTLARLQGLRLRDESGRVLAARPPSLEEALEWARGRTILELDVKQGTPMERVVEAVRRAEAENRAVIITYTLEDAITAHRLDPALMISAPIYSRGDLARLLEADVDRSRILAWTGNREPNSALNVALAERGIEAMFGTNSEWDRRFEREGDTGYAAFADTGIAVLSTDRPEAAYRALDAWDGEGWGPGRCLR
ncbi:MAG: glycerophosphodiester phosphodiesterase family protein [Hyphomonadaceae bacterium]|nr:glycerophosphodiester phosphodiesterase family protein [Hyphomonadaceae bacterium]